MLPGYPTAVRTQQTGVLYPAGILLQILMDRRQLLLAGQPATRFS
jgi:hypothetical protein